MADNDLYEELRKRNAEKKDEQLKIDEAVQKFQRTYDSIQDEQEKDILEFGKREDAWKILEKNNVNNPDEVLDAREDWQLYKDLPAAQDAPLPQDQASNQGINPATSASIAAGGAVGAIAGVEFLKNRKYNNFKKKAEEYAREEAKKWKDNPDNDFARSEEGAYRHALNDYHDRFLRENPNDATKWASKHGDPQLQKALKKKEILDKPNPRRDKKELEKYLSEEGYHYPVKTHRPIDETSQKEASIRIEEAKRIGDTRHATPESTTQHLQSLSRQSTETKSKAGLILPASAAAASAKPQDAASSEALEEVKKAREELTALESSSEKAKQKETTDSQTEARQRADEVERELEEIKKQDKRSGLAAYNPARQSTTVSQSRQGSSNLSYLRARGVRANRRYGAGGFAKSITKNATKKGAKKAGAWVASWILANPIVVIILAAVATVVIAFILIIGAILSACENFWDDPIGNSVFAGIGTITGLCTSSPDGQEITVPPNPLGVTTEKSSLDSSGNEIYSVNNGDNIPYTITVRYDPSVQFAISEEEFASLYLYDVPLFEFEVVSSDPAVSTTATGSDDRSYVRWAIADNPDCVGRYECTFELEVKPNQVDFLAKNAIYVSDIYKEVEVVYNEQALESSPVVSTGPGVQECASRSEEDLWYGADCLPTGRTCNGRWSNQMERTQRSVENYISSGRLSGKAGTGYNFGDPICTFTRNRLELLIDDFVKRKLIKNQSRAEFWKDIAYCEGTPNSFGEQISPMGPAGHFQMNIANPVFKKWTPSGSKLRGDVPWQRQLQNAVSWNNDVLVPIGRDFEFWGAARCLCWHDGYKQKGYCQDIIRHGLQRSPAACGNDKCVERGREGPTL